MDNNIIGFKELAVSDGIFESRLKSPQSQSYSKILWKFPKQWSRYSQEIFFNLKSQNLFSTKVYCDLNGP